MGATRCLSLLPTVLLLLAPIEIWAASVPCEDTGNLPDQPGEWQPRNPEQTLYAYVRCLNDSSASVEMKIRWVRWQPDASPESQCYVKCVSEELRLFDSKEKRFRPERFVKQAEAFFPGDPVELQTLRDNADKMLSGALEETTCEAVFFKYATFYGTHTSTILRMFHGDHRDIGTTYQRLGDQVKQIGQTFVDYCEKRLGSTWNDADSCPPAALLDCILRGFRWITEEGDVNINEIQRDYRTAGYDDQANLCGSASTGARSLFLCLRDQNAEQLSKVMSERNLRTAFYFDISSMDEPWKSAVEFANNLV